MSDIFTFQSDLNEKKYKSVKEVDPVLFYNSENPDLYFLTDAPLTAKNLRELIKHIESCYHSTFKIISVLSFKPSEKDLSKKLSSLYLFDSIDLTAYVKPWAKVITIGRSLYSITGDDVSIDGMFDIITWHTSFFDSNLKCQIFPVPFMTSWLGKDTFENFFTVKQIELAAKFELSKSRLQKPDLVMVENPNEFLLKWTDYDGITAWDLETKGLDPWDENGKVICLTLAFESELKDLKAYFLLFKNIDTNILNKFFKKKKLVGNNLKYDVKWLRVKHGIERESLMIHWDNMKGSHAINEMQYNSLKTDSWMSTNFGGYELDLEKYKEKYPKCKEDYSLIPISVLFPYATMDALVSLLCYFVQQKKIDELDKKCPSGNSWTIRRALEEISIPAINMFADIEITGMSYDWDKLEVVSKKFEKAIEDKKKQVYEALNIPETVNIESGDQLGAYLESIGWEDPGRSKKNNYLTNEESMTYWKKKGHKEVDLLNEYTGLITIMKTYLGDKEKGNGYWQYRKPDNKIHGSFATMMADSWRNKSYNPNLQNVPKRSTVKVEDIYIHEWVRSCFSVPSDDFVISENDAAGLQLRIGASMSQDPTMIDIFTKYGGDMHSITANGVLMRSVTLEEFLKRKKEKEFKDARSKAKGINFSLEFGASAFSFATTLQAEWSLDEVKQYVSENHLDKYRGSLYKNLMSDVDSRDDITDVSVYTNDQLNFSYYWAAAKDIRDKFFATYHGLELWHNKQHEFAYKHGYIQSYWGPIRRVPRLIYRGTGDDKGLLKNQENIVLNSPVQNWEACYMMYNMVRLHKELLDRKLKSCLIGNVHDSILMYVHRSELEIVKEITMRYFSEIMEEQMKGIPYIVEMGYSDYTKDEYWGVTEHEF